MKINKLNLDQIATEVREEAYRQATTLKEIFIYLNASMSNVVDSFLELKEKKIFLDNRILAQFDYVSYNFECEPYYKTTSHNFSYGVRIDNLGYLRCVVIEKGVVKFTDWDETTLSIPSTKELMKVILLESFKHI